MFAYPEFTERAVTAGLNRVHVSFMTCREELYDRITGFEIGETANDRLGITLGKFPRGFRPDAAAK